jgi:hypothetical protein
MARRRTIVLGAAVAAAALLAGCGGGDDESSAEQWANGVCSAITDWTDATRSAAESLQSGGEGSVEDRINTAIDDVKDATSTLGDDRRISARPRPSRATRPRSSCRRSRRTRRTASTRSSRPSTARAR